MRAILRSSLVIMIPFGFYAMISASHISPATSSKSFQYFESLDSDKKVIKTELNHSLLSVYEEFKYHQCQLCLTTKFSPLTTNAYNDYSHSYRQEEKVDYLGCGHTFSSKCLLKHQYPTSTYSLKERKQGESVRSTDFSAFPCPKCKSEINILDVCHRNFAANEVVFFQLNDQGDNIQLQNFVHLILKVSMKTSELINSGYQDPCSKHLYPSF